MDTPNQPTPRRGFVRALLSTLPTLLVLGSLAAVGYWGHHTGWKASKLSQLFGAASAPAEDWCEIHNVPESRCIACHPELAGESGIDWCKEHGVPESKCTACHPEILTTGVAGDWCSEHGLPESGCTICHPELARKGELPPDADAPLVSGDADAHARKLRDPSTCQTHALKVQFASAASLQKCGIHLGQVVERPMSDSVAANAELDYDRTRFARLAPRAAGTARQVLRDLGEAVHAGDVLAWIESVDLGRAKAELLQAQMAVEVSSRAAARVKTSSESGFRTETERLEAEANASAAEIRLFNARQVLADLGLVLPEGILERLPTDKSSANLMPLIAPIDGVVVGRSVIAGELVDPARTIFEVADTSRMWVTLDVPEALAQRLALADPVVFRPDGADADAVTGRITWISTAVDETTRTVKARADVSNAEGRLRAHSFGRARIVLRTSPQAIAVPNEAIQWEGCCHVVFVRLAGEIFQTRKVRLGTKDAAYTEILGGVLPGEVVVTAGSHVLKSEILKSQLGAGCCAAD